MTHTKQTALEGIEAALLALTGAGKCKGRDLEGVTYWTYSLDGEPLEDIEAKTWQSIRDKLLERLPTGDYGIEYVQMRYDAEWEPQEVCRIQDGLTVEPYRSDFDEHNIWNHAQLGVK